SPPSTWSGFRATSSTSTPSTASTCPPGTSWAPTPTASAGWELLWWGAFSDVTSCRSRKVLRSLWRLCLAKVYDLYDRFRRRNGHTHTPGTVLNVLTLAADGSQPSEGVGDLTSPLGLEGVLHRLQVVNEVVDAGAEHSSPLHGRFLIALDKARIVAILPRI